MNRSANYRHVPLGNRRLYEKARELGLLLQRRQYTNRCMTAIAIFDVERQSLLAECYPAAKCDEWLEGYAAGLQARGKGVRNVLANDRK